MAERTGVAIIGVRHLNKASGSSPIYRGGGSIAIIGAARASFLIGDDPDDPESRIFAPNKNNLAPRGLPSLKFAVVTALGATVPKIAWLGTCEVSAREILAQQDSGDGDHSMEDDAVQFLQEVLAAGPKPTKKVQAEARSRGLSWRTVTRAKKKAGVESQKTDYDGGWTLELRRMPSEPCVPEQENLASLAILATLAENQQLASTNLQIDSEGCQHKELALFDDSTGTGVEI